MNKQKINFIIGHKTEIYIDNKVPCGERRFYENTFWKELEEDFEPNYINLYKPFNTKLPFSQSITNIAYHLNNALEVRKKIDKKCVTHIFFEEESALLRLTKIPRAIVTVQDIIPIAFPKWISPHYQLFYKECLKGVRNASRILTISENTKNDLIKHLGIPADKIKTTYLGLSDNFKTQHVSESIYKKYNLNPNHRYILGVSGLGIPRKNLNTIVKILPEIIKEISNCHLIITGYKPNNSNNEIQEFIKKENLEDKVHLLEKVPDIDLCNIYNLAEIFVFPSLYEGFGLPIIEAMAASTPVITGTNSSLPEAGGNAAILVNNESQEEIKNAILKVLKDKNLQQEMIEKGLIHIKKFTWKNYAKKLSETYKELETK